jgi:hypothetical protein
MIGQDLHPRVALVIEELAGSLRNLIAFRHFYRHSCGFMIDAELLNPLVQGVGRTISRLAVPE